MEINYEKLQNFKNDETIIVHIRDKENKITENFQNSTNYSLLFKKTWDMAAERNKNFPLFHKVNN